MSSNLFHQITYMKAQVITVLIGLMVVSCAKEKSKIIGNWKVVSHEVQNLDDGTIELEDPHGNDLLQISKIGFDWGGDGSGDYKMSGNAYFKLKYDDSEGRWSGHDRKFDMIWFGDNKFTITNEETYWNLFDFWDVRNIYTMERI